MSMGLQKCAGKHEQHLIAYLVILQQVPLVGDACEQGRLPTHFLLELADRRKACGV